MLAEFLNLSPIVLWRMANSSEAKSMMKMMGKRIRAARVSSGYADSAAEFSRAIGIDEAAYRKYERGQSVPPIDVLQRICHIANTSSDFLLFGRYPNRVEP